MSKSDHAAKAPEPMDPHSGPTTPSSTPTSDRRAYALDTLISEVNAIYPGTVYDVGGRDMRGVALSVTFSTTEVDHLADLLSMISDDPRIAVVKNEDGPVTVLFRSSPRTQDSREPFGLYGAWLILSEGDDA